MVVEVVRDLRTAVDLVYVRKSPASSQSNNGRDVP